MRAPVCPTSRINQATKIPSNHSRAALPKPGEEKRCLRRRRFWATFTFSHKLKYVSLICFDNGATLAYWFSLAEQACLTAKRPNDQAMEPALQRQSEENP